MYTTGTFSLYRDSRDSCFYVVSDKNAQRLSEAFSTPRHKSILQTVRVFSYYAMNTEQVRILKVFLRHEQTIPRLCSFRNHTLQGRRSSCSTCMRQRLIHFVFIVSLNVLKIAVYTKHTLRVLFVCPSEDGH